MKKNILIGFVIVFLICAYGEEFQEITVKPGDTLWGISNKYLKDPQKWDVILKYNNLPSNPYAALPGMKLKVPVNIIKEEYRAARFTNIVNDVRLRKKESSIWQKANIKDELYNGDALRTNVDSRADIRFYTGQILNLLSNSMVVLRPPKKKEADIHLISGQIKSVDTKVITASAKIIPKVSGTEFGAKIKEDLTTVVQVYKGKTIVEAKGKQVEVSEGFGTEVKLDMPPSAPVKLPPLAKFEDMDTKLEKNVNLKLEGSVLSINQQKIKDVKVKVDVKPQEVPITDKKAPQVTDSNVSDIKAKTEGVVTSVDVSKTISAYRIQVAKDREFEKIIFDKTFDVFTKVNLQDYLPKGNWWFRVSYIDLLGFEGKFSEPKAISIP